MPLDARLEPGQQRALIAHCRPAVLVADYPTWRRLALEAGPLGAGPLEAGAVWVLEAPDGAESRRRRAVGGPARRHRRRRAAPADDLATIVYSSGTGGTPEGLRADPRQLPRAVASAAAAQCPDAGRRPYFSVLPTNHAIDFMVGFVGPYVCGATVVHLRTLRPEFVREAFPRYRIACMAVVPMVLDNLRAGLQARFDGQPPVRRALFRALWALNRALTRSRPNVALSRVLLRPVHRAFGGRLRALFTGGAFTRPDTIEFFGSLGIPVLNGYGLTEAGTAVTLNRRRGQPRRHRRPAGARHRGARSRPGRGGRRRGGRARPHGHGAATATTRSSPRRRSSTAGCTPATSDASSRPGTCRLFGRRKNMIVTAGGKNVYPEDVEVVFHGLPVAEYCVFAEHVVWPERRDERLVIVVRPRRGRAAAGSTSSGAATAPSPSTSASHACLEWPDEFPRTASLKVKRTVLADSPARRRARRAWSTSHDRHRQSRRGRRPLRAARRRGARAPARRGRRDRGDPAHRGARARDRADAGGGGGRRARVPLRGRRRHRRSRS